jgi:CRISPR-associated protein Cmr4
MKSRAFLLHALSPLHAGTGQAADLVDLPTARMKSTGIPFVPGSSIKGVLRDSSRELSSPEDLRKVEAVFGPSENPDAHAGALVVSDVRLVALPVRSFRGTFAWVTSPLLLALAQRDLKTDFIVPNDFEGREARVVPGSVCVQSGFLYLQDLDLPAKESPDLLRWAKYFCEFASPGVDIFSKRFVVVDDDTMSFLLETATQIDARIRLDPNTRTTARGALWFEESLPPETLLLGLLASDRSRKIDVPMTPENVLEYVLPQARELQFGGKASTGRGRCRIIPLKSEKGDTDHAEV